MLLGVEEVFQHVRGVLSVTTGYAGGAARTAQYDMVSSGTTGHAESVKINYDPRRFVRPAPEDSFPSRTIPRNAAARGRTWDRSTVR